MARVFLSYRRADGAYAVGWLAERLTKVDTDIDIRSAFSDSELRCGDNFPEALETEIDSCDVMVVLIGPEWRGERPDGTQRINDPGDWVAREVSAALNHEKRVLPVLIHGAQPLTATDLPKPLDELADLHTLAFDGAADLGDIADHVASHLAEIDLDRARLAGLEKPIELRRFRLGGLGIALTTVAALLGAALGLAIARTRTVSPLADEAATSALAYRTLEDTPGTSAEETEAARIAAETATAEVASAEAFLDHADLWIAGSIVEMTVFAALAVVGHFYVWKHWSEGLTIRWRPIFTSFAFGTLAMAWLILAFSNRPPISFGAQRSWLQSTLGLALVAPWILTLLGAAWTHSTVKREEFGHRAEIIGRLARANRVASAMIAVAIAPIAFSIRGLDLGRSEAQLNSSVSQAQLVAFGIFMTAFLAAGTLWGRMQLRVESEALTKDMAGIGQSYRDHAEHVLVHDPFATKPLWAWGWLLVPLGMSILAVVIT